MGGYARRVAYLDKNNSSHPRDLILDSGNLFIRPQEEVNNFEYLWKKAEVILNGMNKVGYDALNIGEFEYALGVDFLNSVKKKADFPLISTTRFSHTTF